MMVPVFDTNILIDFLQGNPKAKAEFDLYEEKIISRITWMEVMIGVKGREQEDLVRAFLASFTVADIDSHISNEAVKIRRGTRIKLPDAIILATARCNNALLVTRNTRDFKEDSPEVRVPYVTVLKNPVS